MKPLNKIFTFLFIFVILLAAPTTSAALEDAIIAIVNNEVVSLKDLRDYVKSTYVSLVTQGIGEEEIKEIMGDLEKNGVNRLIEDKLILSRANDLGMEVNKNFIDKKIDDVKESYPSEEAFINALIRHGGTLSDMRKKIEDQMKIKFVIDHEVRSKVYVNPQEVTKFYEKHMSDFQKKESVRLDSIYISFGSNKVEARQRVNKALKLIQEGRNFNEVAEQFSNAPSIGIIERGQLMLSIEKIVFHLQEDVPSEVVEVESGFYIFKLTGRLPAKVASLKEVKEDITQRIYRSKFREHFDKWLEELKQDAFIEIKE